MKPFLTDFPFTNASIFLTIIASFTYNILLNRDVGCNCYDVVCNCYIHMFLPCGIFFLLILWTDKTCHQACKYTFACQVKGPGKGCRKGFGMFLVARVVRALCVGHLWVVSVLVDEDWYVCCARHESEQQKQLACMNKENVTNADAVAIITLKNTSRQFGYYVLSGIFFLGVLTSMCEWKRCYSGKKSRLIYDKLLLKEGHKQLKETLREAAKGELSQGYRSKIQDNKWRECLDLAEELIENSNSPRLFLQEVRAPPEEDRNVRAEVHQEPQQQEQVQPRRDQVRRDQQNQDQDRPDQLDQDQLDQDQARRDQLDQDQASQDQVRQDQLDQDQVRQDQLDQDQVRQDQLDQNQLNQNQLDQDQVRPDQLDQDQLKQDQLNQDQVRRDQLDQDQARQDQLDQDQLNQDQLDQDQLDQDQLDQDQAGEEHLG